MNIFYDDYLIDIHNENFWNELQYQMNCYIQDIERPDGYHQYSSAFLPIDIIISYYNEDTIFIETYHTDFDHPKNNGGRYF